MLKIIPKGGFMFQKKFETGIAVEQKIGLVFLHPIRPT